MRIFYVFKIVQMVPNRAKQHIQCKTSKLKNSFDFLTTFDSTGLFLYTLKTSENLWGTGVMKGNQWYEMG